jgi:hypothetical protein
MDWQQITALAIVALTAGAFWVGLLRRRRAARFGAAGACGCGHGSASDPGPHTSVIFRARKDGSEEILVRANAPDGRAWRPCNAVGAPTSCLPAEASAQAGTAATQRSGVAAFDLREAEAEDKPIQSGDSAGSVPVRPP